MQGNPVVGEKITVTIHPPEDKEMTFSPTVTSIKPNQEVKWLGRLLFKGLFDGKHCFVIKDNGNGTSTFYQSEIFSGILIWMVNLEKTKNGFELMNQKIKELTEK